MDNGLATLVVGIITLVGVGYGIYRQEKIAKTSRLHDQKALALNRVREAINKAHQTYMEISYIRGIMPSLDKTAIATLTFDLTEKMAAALTQAAELAGIAQAIQDPILNKAVEKFIKEIEGAESFSKEQTTAISNLTIAINNQITVLLREAANS